MYMQSRGLFLRKCIDANVIDSVVYTICHMRELSMLNIKTAKIGFAEYIETISISCMHGYFHVVSVDMLCHFNLLS